MENSVEFVHEPAAQLKNLDAPTCHVLSRIGVCPLSFPRIDNYVSRCHSQRLDGPVSLLVAEAPLKVVAQRVLAVDRRNTRVSRRDVVGKQGADRVKVLSREGLLGPAEKTVHRHRVSALLRPRRGNGAPHLLEVSEIVPGQLSDHQPDVLPSLLRVNAAPVQLFWSQAPDELEVRGSEPAEGDAQLWYIELGEPRKPFFVVARIRRIVSGQSEAKAKAVDDVDVQEVTQDVMK